VSDLSDPSVAPGTGPSDGIESPDRIEDLLDEMTALLDAAKAMPLSSSVLVNRGEVTARIAAVRSLLPDELAQARWVVRERDGILERANEDAARIVAEAQTESERLVSEQHVVRAAHDEAERVRIAAEDTARRLRLEAEDYVDAKLANFEVVLQKTLGAVERGRERLRGRLDADQLAEPDDLIEADDADSPAVGGW
jgi:cell division septum initiation protein DivIVA